MALCSTISAAESESDAKNVTEIKLTNQEQEHNCTSELLAFISKLKWFNIILLTTLNAVFFIDLVRYPWIENLDLLLFNYCVGFLAAVGLSAGTHRLWTHRSYKAKLPLRILLMVLYSMAGQNSIYDWVRDHRVHHKYTDTDADPHNAKRGFFFSHIGWLLTKKHPDVIRKGKEIDMSDLLEDPVVRFHRRYYLLLDVGLGFILPAIIPPLCWGKCWYWSILNSFVDRYCMTLNLTWIINSAAHAWGNRPFNKNISPTDNYTLACLTLGEGWHNYHHTFPWAYKNHQFEGYNVDASSFCINLFSKLGLAYDLKTPSPEMVRKAAERNGDGSLLPWAYLEVLKNSEKEFPEIAGSNIDNNKIH